jgi:hypothetical protein
MIIANIKKYEHDLHDAGNSVVLAYTRALENLNRMNAFVGILSFAVTLFGCLMVLVVQAGKDAVADYYMALMLLIPPIHIVAFLTEVHVLHFLISFVSAATASHTKLTLAMTSLTYMIDVIS